MGKAAKRTARERLVEQRRVEAQRRKRNRTLGIAAGAVAIVAVIVVAVVLIQVNRSSSGGFNGKLAPISKQADGTVTMAKPGVTAPVLDIFEDFQCPICHEFEKANDTTVKQLAAEGKVKIVYHPMTIFADEGQSKNAHENSVRALNASMAAPAGKWMPFHDQLYANQPDETEAGGFPADQLVKLGKNVGISDPAFASAVTGMTYQKQAEANTARILKSGITGTPTLKLNGSELNLNTILGNKDALSDAVQKAGGSNKS
jgi:protein-disulfide isomerase